MVFPSTLQFLSVSEEKTQARSSVLPSPNLAMDSEYEIGHVRKLQAQHAQMQEKTFTKWINNIFRLGQVSMAGLGTSSSGQRPGDLLWDPLPAALLACTSQVLKWGGQEMLG